MRRLKARSSYYCAVASGNRRIYTDKDAWPNFRTNRIRSPKRASCVNLYVNGVIQPDCFYKVRNRKLIFRSADLPPEGVPIVLQFIRFVRETKRKAGVKRTTGNKNATKRKRPAARRRGRRISGRGGEPMPASLIKLYITAVSVSPTLTVTGGSVDTTVTSAGTQYTALASAGTLDAGSGVLTILATAFSDDDGGAVTGTFPTTAGQYMNVYINGVLQPSGLTSASTDSQIVINDATTIIGDTPIVVQFVSSAADSTLTNPTVEAPDITVNT